LPSGTELVMIELGTRREQRPHARLPLTLEFAEGLATELEHAADSVSQPAGLTQGGCNTSGGMSA
jgi:hypothetical protein